jgi:Predicted restriction endonuclease
MVPAIFNGDQSWFSNKNEFSRRFMDGKQAVMLYLTAGQRPDQFDFDEDAHTLSTGYWPTPLKEYERVIVYKRAEAGGRGASLVGENAGLIPDGNQWHYRARNVQMFEANDDFKTLFGLHPPQRIRYLYPEQTNSKRVASYLRETVADDDDVLKLPPGAATTVRRLQQARLHQQKFRDALLLRWQGTCAVTGIEETMLLRASHIKPYADSSAAECVSAHNGLLLAAGLDALFDKGFVTFDENGRLLRSDFLTPDVAAAFGLKEKMQLSDILTAEAHNFMRHHREKIFLKARSARRIRA